MTTITGQHVYELLQVRSADLDRLTEPVGRAQ